ncbi:unnamed protein product [Cochlearia groenlandica]
MDSSHDCVGSSSKTRNTPSQSKRSVTSFSIDSRHRGGGGGGGEGRRSIKIPEPPLKSQTQETSPEVFSESSVSTTRTKKNQQSEQHRFHPSPTNTFYTAAKQSFSECASTIAIDLEKAGVMTYRGSTGSDDDDESSSSVISNSNNDAAYKPHRANNDKRWVAIQEVRSRVGSSLEAKDFKLMKKLGGGDIGVVYLAELIGTGASFAVKVMEKAAIAARKKLVRAQTEREILQSLDHPFLPTLYSHFETENHSCLVMEFCPGGDLRSLQQKQPGKYFPEHAARFYVAEVLLAMEYLHMLGIIYRDLKPENVLVREDGHIMLSDFDLSLRCAVSPTLVRFAPTTTLDSKSSSYCIQPSCVDQSSCIVQPDCIQPVCFTPRFLSRSKNKNRSNDPTRQVRPLPELMAEPTSARSMSFVGTHEYLAPEIVKGEGHGSAVDWWTFGIFLYELLFGCTPFKGEGNRATLFNVVGQPLRFPEQPNVSFAARDLIRGLLVKEPQHRLAYRRGATEIKQHPFFQSVNWALIRCTSPPQIPQPVKFMDHRAHSLRHGQSRSQGQGQGGHEKLPNVDVKSSSNYVDIDFF